MPVTAEDRPIEALREETVDRLIINYGHGKLSREAFERRLDAALDAKAHAELLELVRDLDFAPDRRYAAEKQSSLGVRVERGATSPAEDTEHIVSVFAGNSRKGAWHVPRAIRSVNIFGGTEFDFSNAHLTTDTTRITVFCLFGGVKIRVPEGMRSVSKALAVFGGIDHRGSETSDPQAPLLVVDGIVLFGGVDIRVKKTSKEKLREFADHVRTMFAAPPRV